MKKNLFILGIVLLFLLSNCSQIPASREGNRELTPSNKLYPFTKQVEYLINAPHFQPAHIGVYIEDSKSGEVIYSNNAFRLFMPASNMKIVTTAAATEILGPDYVFRTKFYTDGTIEDGILKGNLWIKGSGDPTISGRFYDGNIFGVFEQWADTLKKMGINRIAGSIIGDDNIFPDESVGYGWEWDDLSYYYAAKFGGLSFNDNCLDLHFLPGDTIGVVPEIIQEPISNYSNIQNDLITVHPDSEKTIDFQQIWNTNKIRVFGTIPINSDTVTDWITVEDPTDFFLAGLRKCLDNSGLTFSDIQDIDNMDISIVNYEKLTPLFEHHSVPLKKIIRATNKESNNFFAETLQQTVGIKTELKWLENIGVDVENIFICDGSGLSRHSMVTPYQIATILRRMKNHKDGAIFKESLPIGGVDGTLENRMKATNAAEHIFAKTGHVEFVSNLSGYITAGNGKEYIFSILLNHFPTPSKAADALQDKILTLLYNLEY